MDERDNDIIINEEKELDSIESMIKPYIGMTLEEVVSSTSKEKNLKYDEVIRDVYKLIKKGKVKFVDPKPPKNFFTYFISLYDLWFWVLSLFSGITLFSIYLMPQIYPFIYIRYLCGAIFTLYIPGFALVEAIYPRINDLNYLERFALSVGLSIAIVPLGGFVLNFLPFGIRPYPSLEMLLILVYFFSFLSVYRKYAYWKISLKDIYAQSSDLD